MMNEQTIANAALDAVQKVTNNAVTGQFDALHEGRHGCDGQLHMKIQDEALLFFADIKTELREYQLPQIFEKARIHEPFVVVAERIFPAIKEKLRANDIGYLDTAGNIYMRKGKTFIWLDGNKPAEQEKVVTNRAFTKTGLRTVFYLLLHKEAINLPYRTLAEQTGVGLGNVKNILEGLKEAGYILFVNDKIKMLNNRKALLDRWIAGYKETLKPTLLLGKYRFLTREQQELWQTLPVQPGDTVWGGEPAGEVMTNQITPHFFTVYTTENRFTLMANWKLLPDTEGNVGLYKKFWKPQRGVEEQYAPPLLVYADLIMTGDPRNREIADTIYNQQLRHDFE